MLRSTPRVSHKQAAVCRRSCSRRPMATVSHSSHAGTPNARAARRRDRCQVASGDFPLAARRTASITTSASGTRRADRPLVILTLPPSVWERATQNAGEGSSCKSPPGAPSARPTAARSSQRSDDVGKDGRSEDPVNDLGQLVLTEGPHLGRRLQPRRQPAGVTGLSARRCSATHHAKKLDNEARYRRIEPSDWPLWSRR